MRNYAYSPLPGKPHLLPPLAGRAGVFVSHDCHGL